MTEHACPACGYYYPSISAANYCATADDHADKRDGRSTD